MYKKRIIIAILTWGILGIFCVIGISSRLGFVGNEIFILATWINRVLMGLVIGLAPYYKIKNNSKNVLLRGLFFGFIISWSFYLSTEFKDTLGFIAGIIYGIIIDYITTRYEQKKIFQ